MNAQAIRVLMVPRATIWWTASVATAQQDIKEDAVQ